eukprot:3360414-Amphidinium_carterae.1
MTPSSMKKLASSTMKKMVMKKPLTRPYTDKLAAAHSVLNKTQCEGYTFPLNCAGIFVHMCYLAAQSSN